MVSTPESLRIEPFAPKSGHTDISSNMCLDKDAKSAKNRESDLRWW